MKHLIRGTKPIGNYQNINNSENIKEYKLISTIEIVLWGTLFAGLILLIESGIIPYFISIPMDLKIDKKIKSILVLLSLVLGTILLGVIQFFVLKKITTYFLKDYSSKSKMNFLQTIQLMYGIIYMVLTLETLFYRYLDARKLLTLIIPISLFQIGFNLWYKQKYIDNS